ncbi:MAG: cardiolipin synthase [Spirochaetota bacterium]
MKRHQLTPFLRDIERREIGGLSGGNAVELIIEGSYCFKQFCNEILHARSTINLETYIFRSDDAGWEIARRLADAAKRGVEVNMIYDAIGCIKTSRSIFTYLKKNGVALIEYNPIEPWRRFFNITFRDHRKILVIDSRVAFIGGLNIGNEYSGNLFTNDYQRDTHVRIEGRAVTDIQFFFIENCYRCGGRIVEQWKYFPDQKKTGNTLLMVLASRAHYNVKPIRVSYLSAIENARRSIYIENAYFIPDHRILRALSAAVRRGVDVRIMLTRRYVMPFVQHAVRFLYKKYLQSGIRVFEYTRTVLHAKTAVIDGIWSTVGSSNIDRLSFWYNLEINAVVLDEDFGTRMNQVFFEDLDHCEEITFQSISRRSVLTFLKQWISYRFRNIL